MVMEFDWGIITGQRCQSTECEILRIVASFAMGHVCTDVVMSVASLDPYPCRSMNPVLSHFALCAL